MGFGEAISSGFKNYVNFSGRAQRSAYWWWVLFVLIVDVVAAIIDIFVFHSAGSTGPLGAIVGLALFLPGLSVAVRRLHDLNQSGWWVLLILFVWGSFFWKGTTGENRFGPDPLGG